jgi:ABC-type Fe3+ transport system permease subunit
VATIIWIGILVLTVFAAQLIVQQMLRKRYRRFAISVIDNSNGEAPPNNHLFLLERFKVVWALFWRFVPVAGIVYYLCKSHLNPLPPLVNPLTQLFRLGFLAGLVFVAPLAVLFALRRRYTSFKVCLTEPVGKAES